MNAFIANWRNQLPGMRAIKTAIAVFFTVSLSGFSPVLSPFFMSLAAIITIQVSTADSLKMGRNRILGTTVGAVIGLMFVLIQPESALFSAIGVILLIHICNRFNWNGSTQIATFVFMAIMVNLNGEAALTYSLSRLIETIIGVIVGLLVNYFVFPYNNAKVIRSKFEGIYQLLGETLREVLREDPEHSIAKDCLGDLDVPRQALLSIRDEIALYKEEARILAEEKDDIIQYEETYRLYWDVFEHMKHLKMIYGAVNELSDLEGASYRELLIVYKYHLKRIREDLKALELV